VFVVQVAGKYFGIASGKIVDIARQPSGFLEEQIPMEGYWGSVEVGRTVAEVVDIYRLADFAGIELPFEQAEQFADKSALVVEGSSFCLSVLDRYMDSLGFAVNTASSAEQAIDAVESQDYDVLLLDLGLERSLLERIVRMQKELRVGSRAWTVGLVEEQSPECSQQHSMLVDDVVAKLDAVQLYDALDTLLSDGGGTQ